MSSVKSNQRLNVKNSQTYDDSVDVSTAITGGDNLEFDLNILRSLAKLITGGLTFFEAPVATLKSIIAPRGAFSAHQNSVPQSIPQASQTKLVLQSEKFDLLNEFSLVDNEYVASVDGLYQFTTNVGLDGVGSGIRFTVKIIKDPGGTEEIFEKAETVPPGESEIMVETTAMMQLAAGDKVSVFLYHNDGSARDTLAGPSQTRFFGRKVDL